LADVTDSVAKVEKGSIIPVSLWHNGQEMAVSVQF
jgi:hypothetical protein